MIHQNLLVIHAIVRSRELEPPSSRRVIAGCRIVLCLKREGLNDCGIARLCKRVNRECKENKKVKVLHFKNFMRYKDK